jgi:hypothetical protein
MAGPAPEAIRPAPKRPGDRNGRAHTEQKLLVAIRTGRAAPHSNARIGDLISYQNDGKYLADIVGKVKIA